MGRAPASADYYAAVGCLRPTDCHRKRVRIAGQGTANLHRDGASRIQQTGDAFLPAVWARVTHRYTTKLAIESNQALRGAFAPRTARIVNYKLLLYLLKSVCFSWNDRWLKMPIHAAWTAEASTTQSFEFAADILEILRVIGSCESARLKSPTNY